MAEKNKYRIATAEEMEELKAPSLDYIEPQALNISQGTRKWAAPSVEVPGLFEDKNRSK